MKFRWTVTALALLLAVVLAPSVVATENSSALEAQIEETPQITQEALDTVADLEVVQEASSVEAAAQSVSLSCQAVEATDVPFQGLTTTEWGMCDTMPCTHVSQCIEYCPVVGHAMCRAGWCIYGF